MEQIALTNSDSIIAEMLARIVRLASPDRVILFGSHARGAAGPDSDVDLMVIEADPFGPGRSRRAELTRLWTAVADAPVSKDILVYSRTEYEQWKGALNHIIGRAHREGKVLYERA